MMTASTLMSAVRALDCTQMILELVESGWNVRVAGGFMKIVLKTSFMMPTEERSYAPYASQ